MCLSCTRPFASIVSKYYVTRKVRVTSMKPPLLRTIPPNTTVLVCVIPCIIYSWTTYSCWGNGLGFRILYNLPERNDPVLSSLIFSVSFSVLLLNNTILFLIVPNRQDRCVCITPGTFQPQLCIDESLTHTNFKTIAPTAVRSRGICEPVELVPKFFFEYKSFLNAFPRQQNFSIQENDTAFPIENMHKEKFMSILYFLYGFRSM